MLIVKWLVWANQSVLGSNYAFLKNYDIDSMIHNFISYIEKDFIAKLVDPKSLYLNHP